MKKPLDLIIRNTKSTPRTAEETHSQTLQLVNSQRLIENQLQFQVLQNQEQRLRMLQGNLRLLQKKYRQNLKEGFDNKIKSYRLQAVVQRKLLRQAVQQAQKMQSKEEIKLKTQKNEQFAKMREERALISKVQKMQKDKFVKERNQQQKKRMSLTLYQHESQLNAMNRAIHNNIRSSEQHSGQKKAYFQQLKKTSQTKEVIQTKRELLSRIVKNTEKLKDLRANLRDMETFDPHPFLTIS